MSKGFPRDLKPVFVVFVFVSTVLERWLRALHRLCHHTHDPFYMLFCGPQKARAKAAAADEERRLALEKALAGVAKGNSLPSSQGRLLCPRLNAQQLSKDKLQIMLGIYILQ
jgi:hypothetical protein